MKKWAFWPFLEVLRQFKAQTGGQEPHKACACRYPREWWGSCLRHLPTAGVCDLRLGVSLRLLLTAGVCVQHLGRYLRLLLTAGVCEQYLGGYLRLLLTAGVCEQPLRGYLRLLLNAGLWEQRLNSVLKPAHCQYLQPVSRHSPPTFAHRRCMRKD